jgi:hypothetical protein
MNACTMPEGNAMVATIQITPYVHIQGVVARVLPNGQIGICLGGREYVGMPLRRPAPRPVAATQH